MRRKPHLKPSEIYWLLRDLDNEGLLYLLAIAGKKHIQKAVSQFVTSLKDVQPLISGQTLLDEGYRPGPQFRTMLNQLVEAQLNGQVHTPPEALSYIRSRYPLEKD